MDYQKSYLLMWAGLVVGTILMAVGGALSIKWLLALGGVAFLAAVFQTMLFFHCPHCGGHWNPRGGIPCYCPNCGEYIQ